MNKVSPIKIIYLIALFILQQVNAQNSEMNIKYPETKKVDTVDIYFNTSIKDPYRWLEDDRSKETEQWVKSENDVTFNYLEQIPFRYEFKNRLTELWNYEKYSAPVIRGEYTYFAKNDGLQDQSVFYRQKGNEAPEIFLDPNNFSKDGTTSLGAVSFSKKGTKVAYSISEAGSDWRKIIILDAISKEIIEDTIKDVKFSSISWYKNEGFYYSSYDKPTGSVLSAKTDQHKLYYHRIGTKQKEDKVIFGLEKKRRYVDGYVTENQKFLVISAANSSSGNELYIKDLSNSNSELKTIVDNFDSDNSIIDADDNLLYISTDLNAPNKKVITVDTKKLKPEYWVDFIPETENVLSITTGSDFFFADYMIDAISQVKQYDKGGKLIREIELPGIGTASGFRGKREDEKLYFTFSNYTTPSIIYSFNPKKGSKLLYKKSKIDFNSGDYETKQVFFTSKDGTKVPMFISYKKGIELNGKTPTILYGYGGFNVSLTPSFSIIKAVWMEQGGIYAVANLRGGGEYGKEWHDAGTQMKKQNVFDDFIAAGEFLIDKKYTSSDYLAIFGGSNGGLLVGATMTQRPDLAKVAIPAVGVLDMLRYHTFTSGAGWAYDYGTSEQSKEMFDYLKGYSPLHNVKKGIHYPATLITTGDHDDRVVPAHSFKYAAELQEKQTGNNPVLIRIETNAGHGAGTPVSKTIDLYTDIFSFILYNMGYEDLIN